MFCLCKVWVALKIHVINFHMKKINLVTSIEVGPKKIHVYLCECFSSHLSVKHLHCCCTDFALHTLNIFLVLITMLLPCCSNVYYKRMTRKRISCTIIFWMRLIQPVCVESADSEGNHYYVKTPHVINTTEKVPQYSFHNIKINYTNNPEIVEPNY